MLHPGTNENRMFQNRIIIWHSVGGGVKGTFEALHVKDLQFTKGYQQEERPNIEIVQV